MKHDEGTARSRSVPRLGFGQFYGTVVADASARDVAVRMVEGRPREGIPRHTHATAHLCLILRGAYETSTRNHAGRCGTSTLLFHPAGTTHEDRFLEPEGACLVVSIRAGALEDLDGPPLSRRSVAMDDAEIGFPGARMTREVLSPDRFSPLALDGLALEMIGRVAEREERIDGAPPWLDRARAFVHDHASEPARVADVAEAAGVHPVHLARVFRQRLGLSPGEYLRRVRVREAMEMMGSGDDGLATIAVRAGFCDQSELTKAFRREIGSTPAAWRRHLRG